MVWFLLGMAAGIALHRFIMVMTLEIDPDSRCAYCKWMNRKKDHHYM